MFCQDALLKMIERQTEGVMYHDGMTDYYAFLHLTVLKDMHHEQTKEELCSLRKAKCLYIKHFGMLPKYSATNPNAIPVELMTKTTADIDEESLRVLIKQSLESYLSWERETCEIYKRMAMTFKENMHFVLYREACEMIEEAQKEICKINEMIIDAASYDYCPSYFK